MLALVFHSPGRSNFGQFEQPSLRVRYNNVQQTVPKESIAHYAQSQFYRIQ